MNWNALVPPLLMLIAAGSGLAFMATRLRRARLIEDTPSSRIRSAPQGYVELSGFARADADSDAAEALIAPLTKIPCVWYRYRVERYESSGKNSRWQTIDSGSSEHWFVLDDDSGRCHVDPRGAEVTAKTCQRWKGQSERPIFNGRLQPSSRGAFLNTASKISDALAFNFGSREYRYTEWRIHAGEFVYALGNFSTLHAPTGAERTQQTMKNLLNQWKQNRDELLARFDRNGDGEIDLQEWDAARRAAANAAQAQTLREPPPPAVNVLGRPANRQQPYLIATTDPERLARRLRWQALASLLIGFGIAAIIGWHGFRR